MDIDIEMEICDNEFEMSDDELKKELQLIDEEEEKAKMTEISIKKEEEANDEKEGTPTSSVHVNLKDVKEEGELDSCRVENEKDDEILEKKELQTYFKEQNKRDVDMFRNKMIDFRRLKKPLKATKDSDPGIIGREIAYRLHEVKMKLICNVAVVLGVELAMEIFEETKRIVLTGGLKTDNGDRKRSPGGTFLYLMKSRGYASKRQIKEIFKFDEKVKKCLRKKRNEEKKVTSKYLVPTEESSRNDKLGGKCRKD